MKKRNQKKNNEIRSNEFEGESMREGIANDPFFFSASEIFG